jgi:hypothetical protein
MTSLRQYRAGQTVEDYCRQCHEDRIHTIIVVDGESQPLRVTCDFCRSAHNYRGGPKTGSVPHFLPPTGMIRDGATTAAGTERRPSRAAEGADDHLRAAERTDGTDLNSLRNVPVMTQTPIDTDLEATIRRIIREETGLTPVAPAEKWRGGQLVLRPGKPGVQEKAMPIDTFFNKIVMLRNRLRTLEQQVNASALPDDQKLKLQGYITGCYGSLTSFNVLFADDDDRFVGSGGD